jgi:hypothetical protein
MVPGRCERVQEPKLKRGRRSASTGSGRALGAHAKRTPADLNEGRPAPTAALHGDTAGACPDQHLGLQGEYVNLPLKGLHSYRRKQNWHRAAGRVLVTCGGDFVSLSFDGGTVGIDGGSDGGGAGADSDGSGDGGGCGGD